MHSATVMMSNETGDVAMARDVMLPHPPRPGMRLKGLFGNGTLLVARVTQDASGHYLVVVGISLLDLVPLHAVEHIARKHGWTYDDPFEEDTQPPS